MEQIIKKRNKILFYFTNCLKKNWKYFLFSFGIVFLVALIGSFLVNTNSAWFNSLILPEFYPPSWLFSVMWSIIYLLVALGLYLLFKEHKFSKKLLILYGVNGILNIIWNIVFFRINSLFFGVVVLVILIIFAYFLVKELYEVNKTSFYFTLPYFIWLFFAFLLNYAIYFLN